MKKYSETHNKCLDLSFSFKKQKLNKEYSICMKVNGVYLGFSWNYMVNVAAALYNYDGRARCLLLYVVADKKS